MKKTVAVSTDKDKIFWKTVIAIGGMTLGTLLLAAALISWGISAFESISHDYLELLLIAASFVSFGVGAHGLDLVREAEIEERKRRLNL